jgi:aldose 1-epimerase
MSSRASIVLTSGSAKVVVEPQFGGRLSSFTVGDIELLWQPDGDMPGASHPFGWGSFVMVPYAGRIRRGQLVFRSETHRLPITMDPHAIHGTVFDAQWTVNSVGSGRSDGTGGAAPEAARCVLSCDLGPDWPFRGTAHQEIQLAAGSSDGTGTLSQRMWVEAAEDMPVTFGWHPWFPRNLQGASGPLRWAFDRSGVQMFHRDSDGIATSVMESVPPGPWDDCFEGVGTVTVSWPDLITLSVDHDCPVVVLFDGLDHAVCVEPQTGPPDGTAVWGDRVTLQAGDTRSASMVWTWKVSEKAPA